MRFSASAPATTMILGEHAVVYGKPAMVAALNRRLTVQLKPREDTFIRIHSALATYESSLSQLTPHPALKFVLGVIEYYRMKLTHGFELTITSDIPPDQGLGSSAAVLLTTTFVIQQYLHELKNFGVLSLVSPHRGQATNGGPTRRHPSISRIQLLKESHQILKKIQGAGSGADLAAALYGGFIIYDPCTYNVTDCPQFPHISLFYCGYKTATPIVIQKVADIKQQDPRRFDAAVAAIGEIVQQAVPAVLQGDWISLGKYCQAQEKIMETLELNDPTIDAILSELNRNPQVLGAKISGSGLGDCVLSINRNECAPEIAHGQKVAVTIATEGLTHECA